MRLHLGISDSFSSPVMSLSSQQEMILSCIAMCSCRETCAILCPDIRDFLLSMEGKDIFEDGRGCAKLREIVQLKSIVRSNNKGIKEKRGFGDVSGKRQQGEARHGREKREQSAVPMCQGGAVVTLQLSSR